MNTVGVGGNGKRLEQSDDGIYSFDSRKVNDSSPDRITSREDTSVERELSSRNINKIIAKQSDDIESVDQSDSVNVSATYIDQSDISKAQISQSDARNTTSVDQSDLATNVLRKRHTDKNKEGRTQIFLSFVVVCLLIS